MRACVWKCMISTFINITYIEIKKFKKIIIWTRIEPRWRLLTFRVKIVRSKNPSNNTLYFIEVLRRELRASMKRWKKAEFFGCGCCNRLKKLILCKNSSKIKNVCNRFPKVIQPFCMKKNQGILSEHLSGPGRNWCRFARIHHLENYLFEIGNSPFCPITPHRHKISSLMPIKNPQLWERTILG